MKNAIRPTVRRFIPQRSVRLVPGLLAITLVACAGGMMMFETSLTDPQEGGILLIGSVVVGGVNEVRELEPLAVYVMGDVEQEGEIVRVGYTVTPDVNGFFALENVPPGDYTLKGVQYGWDGIPRHLIWHPMRYGTDRWQRQDWTTIPAYTGEIDAVEQRGRVADFGHNIFIVSSGTDIRHHHRTMISGETFDLQYSYDRPRSAEYFLQQFPGSGWRQALRESLGRGE
jgi:hypothetical protein